MKKILTLFLVLFFFSLNVKAQDELNIFGYYQGTYSNLSSYDLNLPINPFLNNGSSSLLRSGSSTQSFLLQQLNLFFQKDFEGKYGDFTTFVNFEVTNNYSSNNSWGTFNMEEAWIKWSLSNSFNLKVGQMIPKFNYLNEIKNRTPLLPYIMRPLIYETYVAGIFDQEDYIPEKAFLQIYGEKDLGNDAVFNYAAFVGNSERSYIAKETNLITIPGVDSSKYKSFGGRLGLQYKDLSFGVSGVFDRDNKNDIFSSKVLAPGNLSGISVNPVNGDLKRFKLGLDLNFSVDKFVFNGEFIKVKYDPTTEQENYLKSYRQNVQQALVKVGGQAAAVQQQLATNPNNSLLVLQLSQLQAFSEDLQKELSHTLGLGDGFDKMFYYANLGYNISEEFFVYGYYSYLEDEMDLNTADGFKNYSFGITWKPTYAVSFKGQYAKYKIDSIDFDLDSFFVGFSVFF